MYKETAEADAAGLHGKASFLYSAGGAFLSAAEEAQKEHPSQQSIDWFTESARLYKETAEADAACLHDKASSLNSAGGAFLSAAEEAQKPNPSQQIIDWLAQSARLHQQAAAAQDTPGLNDKAVYLNKAGNALFEATWEAQKENPSQQSIDWFTRSASLYKEAAEADAPGLNDKAMYLNNAGNAFSRAAQEAQKENPNQLVIERHLSTAKEYSILIKILFKST